MSAEGDPEELQRLVAQAVESHLRRLVVGLLELHDQPADASALAAVRDEAQAVASALLTVELDHLSRAARAISDTLESLAATGEAVPTGAVVALLDATAGLRAVVAARGEPETGPRGPESLERELAALAPWHPMTAALRAASGETTRGRGSRAGSARAAEDDLAEDPASMGLGSRRGDSATPAGSSGGSGGAGPGRLRVVPAGDLRSTAEGMSSHVSDPAALGSLLGGLTQLADVLVRTTETLQHRLAELAELPELGELDEAVRALGRSAGSGAATAAGQDRRRPSR